MIEIGEKCESGIRKVMLREDGKPETHLGDIVKTDTNRWLAIPRHHRNLPTTAHKLRRGAIEALQ